MEQGTDQGMDSGDAGRWLTYRELAESRQIDRHSAVKLVLKHGWRRQRDNQGVLRALVPEEWTAPRGKGMAKSMPQGMDQGTDFANAISAFETALGTLREQLERSEKGREAERQRAGDLRSQINMLNTEMALIQATAGHAEAVRRAAEARAEQAAREAQEALQDADALRAAEAARLARGRWARLRAAWRGE